MSKENTENNYKTQRIDNLEDRRFGDLCTQVGDMHKMLVGNGQEGIIQTVAKNKAKIKIIMWLCSVLLAGVLGSYFKIPVSVDAMGDMPAIEFGVGGVGGVGTNAPAMPALSLM